MQARGLGLVGHAHGGAELGEVDDGPGVGGAGAGGHHEAQPAAAGEEAAEGRAQQAQARELEEGDDGVDLIGGGELAIELVQERQLVRARENQRGVHEAVAGPRGRGGDGGGAGARADPREGLVAGGGGVEVAGPVADGGQRAGDEREARLAGAVGLVAQHPQQRGVDVVREGLVEAVEGLGDPLDGVAVGGGRQHLHRERLGEQGLVDAGLRGHGALRARQDGAAGGGGPGWGGQGRGGRGRSCADRNLNGEKRRCGAGGRGGRAWPGLARARCANSLAPAAPATGGRGLAGGVPVEAPCDVPAARPPPAPLRWAPSAC